MSTGHDRSRTGHVYTRDEQGNPIHILPDGQVHYDFMNETLRFFRDPENTRHLLIPSPVDSATNLRRAFAEHFNETRSRDARFQTVRRGRNPLAPSRSPTASAATTGRAPSTPAGARPTASGVHVAPPRTTTSTEIIPSTTPNGSSTDGASTTSSKTTSLIESGPSTASKNPLTETAPTSTTPSETPLTEIAPPNSLRTASSTRPSLTENTPTTASKTSSTEETTTTPSSGGPSYVTSEISLALLETSEALRRRHSKSDLSTESRSFIPAPSSPELAPLYRTPGALRQRRLADERIREVLKPREKSYRRPTSEESAEDLLANMSLGNGSSGGAGNMIGNNGSSDSSANASSFGNLRGQSLSPALTPASQINGGGAANALAGMTNGNMPMNAGQQMDLNHLYEMVLELSDVLKNNRDMTKNIVGSAEDLMRRAHAEGSPPNVHQVNGEISAARIADLERALAKERRVVDILKNEQVENSKLIKEYEAAVGTMVEQIRNYCQNNNMHFLAQKRHYNNLLQAERDSHLESRLDRDHWHAQTMKCAEMIRTAYRLRSQEEEQPIRIVAGLQNEVRAYRFALGMEPEKPEEEFGWEILKDAPPSVE